MTQMKADAETTQQLIDLGYHDQPGATRHDRPLLVCDVDEVVLHLVDPFVEVLQERGYTLKSHSFKLTGNVFDANGREASQEEVWQGLTQLFEEQAKRQSIVDGVVENLNALSKHIDIIFLTNMPHAFGNIRRDYLASHGLDFPLVTNTRSKVPAIQILQTHCHRTIGVIDDTPKNLEQVNAGIENIHLFHFMANEEFRGLAGPIAETHISSGDWTATANKIATVLIENT